jgi:hydroxyacylglutathione hydrolase/adenylyltransferase/sulfurtransferase
MAGEPGPSPSINLVSMEDEVTPERVAEWIASDSAPQLIDVRETYEHEAGRIGGARHIALGQLPAESESIDRARPVVFMCRVGARSAMAAQAFRAAGYDAYTMQGGLLLWSERGLPLEPDGGYVAEH